MLQATMQPNPVATDVNTQKTYAFVYTPGPNWLTGRPVTEQNLGAHRVYLSGLCEQRHVLFGGPFLDDAGGGFVVVRAAGRDAATSLLAADPAIRDGVLTGIVRPWHAVFNETQELQASRAEAHANRRAVQAVFDAVDRRDRAGVRVGYDENITINEAPSLPYGGEYRGIDGALRHGEGFRTAWDRFQPHEERGLNPRIIADGDHVVVLWRHKVENAETGDKIDLPAVSVYRMENAKIIDSRMFHFDTAALLQFLARNALATASTPQGGT